MNLVFSYALNIDPDQLCSNIILFLLDKIGKFDGRFSHNAFHMSLDARKQVFRVSNQVQHKLACTVTENS